MNEGALVLCADDDEDILSLVSLRLANAGFRVARAHDGERALALVGELRPDLVVLDLAMPRRSGAEVLERLRSDEATRHLPVILLSARARPDDVERGLEAGADAYLAKPFRAAELVELARNLLAGPPPAAA